MTGHVRQGFRLYIPVGRCHMIFDPSRVSLDIIAEKAESLRLLPEAFELAKLLKCTQCRLMISWTTCLRFYLRILLPNGG